MTIRTNKTRRTFRRLLAGTVVTASMTTGLAAAPVHAAEVGVTDITAQFLNIQPGQVFDGRSTINVRFDFTIEKGAKAGDVIPFTVYKTLESAANNVQVRDDKGVLIGTLNGQGQRFDLTLAESVNTSGDIKGSVEMPFDVVENEWWHNQSRPVHITANGGLSGEAGTILRNDPNPWNPKLVNRQLANAVQPTMLQSWVSPAIPLNSPEAGKTKSLTFTTDSKTSYDCSNMNPSYRYGKDQHPNNLTTYEVKSIDDPLQFQLVKCSQTEATFSYVVPKLTETVAGFKLFVSDRDNPAARLTGTTIANRSTGPFTLNVKGDDPNSSTAMSSTSATGEYFWPKASGVLGLDTPTAFDDETFTPFGTPVTIDVLENDTTANDKTPFDRKTLALIDNQGQKTTSVKMNEGVFTVVDGRINFTPRSDYYTEYNDLPSVRYTVQDVRGRAIEGLLSVYVDSPAPPLLTDDEMTVDYSDTVFGDVLANDQVGEPLFTFDKNTLSLVDENFLPVESLTFPEGVFRVKDGKVAFTPTKGWLGTTPTISYTVADQTGNYSFAYASFTVVNRGPIVRYDKVTTFEDESIKVRPLTNDTARHPVFPIVPTSLTLLDAKGAPADRVTTTKGTWTRSYSVIKFTPRRGTGGTTDKVRYRVTDSNGVPKTGSIVATIKKVEPSVLRIDKKDVRYRGQGWIRPLLNDISGTRPLDPKTLQLKTTNTRWVKKDTTVVFTARKGDTGPFKTKYTVKDTRGRTWSSFITVWVSASN